MMGETYDQRHSNPIQRESYNHGDGDQRESYTHGYSDRVGKDFTRRTAAECAAFFLPHLKRGANLLDCGIGPGTITVGLAETVAPGHVVGIDIEPIQIKRAEAYAAEFGITNIRFQVGSVY